MAGTASFMVTLFLLLLFLQACLEKCTYNFTDLSMELWALVLLFMELSYF